MSVLLWLIVALCLDRVALKLTGDSYLCAYAASYGAVGRIQRGTAERVLARRMLVPALIYWIERLVPALKPYRLPAIYEPLRIGALAAALALAERAIGLPGALLVAALLPASFLFDYFDWPYELAGLAAALTGNLQLAVLFGGLHALARPTTAPLCAVTYLLVTGDWVGAGLVTLAVGVGMLPGLVNVRQALWAQTYGLWRQNLRDVRTLFENRPFYLSEIAMSLLVAVGVLWAVLSGHAGPAWPVPLALIAVQWTLVRAAETRTVAVCLLWIVGGLLK